MSSKTTKPKHYITNYEHHLLVEIMKTQLFSERQSVAFCSFLRSYERSAGTKAVIEWLKDTKKWLIQSLESDDKEAWLKSTSSKMRKLLFRVARKGRREWTAAMRMTCIYTRWCATEATPDQWEKFISTIGKDGPLSVPKLKTNMSLKRRIASIAKQSDFRLDEPSSPKKTSPLSYGRKESEMTLMQHLTVALRQRPDLVLKYKGIGKDLFINGDAETMISRLHRSRMKIRRADEPDHIDGYVGKIGTVLKDGGLKVRFIANPLRWFQIMLTKLQSVLNKVLTELPESATGPGRAAEACSWIQSELKAGKKVYCFDLSAATDHFPLSLQYRTLKNYLPPDLQEHLELWKDICEGKWHTPEGDALYKVGQPMGTGPSFPSFAIVHILLVRHLGGTQDSFRIMGDDVIITDDVVAQKYADCMKTLGVVINTTKSVISRVVAEFAGRLIDKHGILPIFKGRKHSKMDPCGMLKQYGLRAKALIPNNIREEAIFYVRWLRHYENVHLYDDNLICEHLPNWDGVTPSLIFGLKPEMKAPKSTKWSYLYPTDKEGNSDPRSPIASANWAAAYSRVQPRINRTDITNDDVLVDFWNCIKDDYTIPLDYRKEIKGLLTFYNVGQSGIKAHDNEMWKPTFRSLKKLKRESNLLLTSNTEHDAQMA